MVLPRLCVLLLGILAAVCDTVDVETLGSDAIALIPRGTGGEGWVSRLSMVSHTLLETGG